MLLGFPRSFANGLMLYLPHGKSGVRDGGKRRQRAKETINSGSQMDSIDDLL